MIEIDNTIALISIIASTILMVLISKPGLALLLIVAIYTTLLIIGDAMVNPFSV